MLPTIQNSIKTLNNYLENNNNVPGNINTSVAKDLKAKLKALQTELKTKAKTVDKTQRIEIEKKIQKSVALLEPTLISLLKKSIEQKDPVMEEFYYNTLIALTRLRPRNNYQLVDEKAVIIDPISLQPITGENEFYATSRYVYDISTLAQYIQIRKKYLDPITGKPFLSSKDNVALYDKIKSRPDLIQSLTLTFFSSFDLSNNQSSTSPPPMIATGNSWHVIMMALTQGAIFHMEISQEESNFNLNNSDDGFLFQPPLNSHEGDDSFYLGDFLEEVDVRDYWSP